MDGAYVRCRALLTQHAAHLAGVAELLLAKETINQHDIEAIAGPRPWAANASLKEYISSAFEEGEKGREREAAEAEAEAKRAAAERKKEAAGVHVAPA